MKDVYKEGVRNNNTSFARTSPNLWRLSKGDMEKIIFFRFFLRFLSCFYLIWA